MKYKNVKDLFDLDNLILTTSTFEADAQTFVRFIGSVGNALKNNGIPREYALIYFNKRVHGRDILTIVIRGSMEYALYTSKRPTAMIRCEDLKGEKMVRFSYDLSEDIVKFFSTMNEEVTSECDMHYVADLGTGHIVISNSNALKTQRTPERVF